MRAPRPSGPAPSASERRRCRKHLAWPLTLALAAPGVHAAAYLPGAEPDPPTGEPPPATAVAEEPLRGNGIVWRFAPWRLGGSVGLDSRWTRSDLGDTSRSTGLVGEVEAASYLWQPWFAQVRLGLGFTASHGSTRSGDAFGSESDTNTSKALNGSAELSLFPVSRFPFRARFSVSDSRSSGDSLGTEQRSKQLSLSQQYRPPAGNDHYQISVDWSELSDAVGHDTLFALGGSARFARGAHDYDFYGAFSDNRRDDTDARSRNASLSATHRWVRNGDANVQSLATWNRSTNGTGDVDFGSQVMQVSTLAAWRPREGEPLHWAGHGVSLVGSARWAQVQAVGGGDGVAAQSFSATLAGTADLSAAWRSNASMAFNHASSSFGAGTSQVNANAGANWTPSLVEWGAWRWMPSASFSASLTRGSSGDSERLGAQASHSLSRELFATPEQRLSFSASQGLGVTAEFDGVGNDAAALADDAGDPRVQRSLTHNLSLFWQSVTNGTQQRYASVSLSDSRAWSREGDTQFQLANLQLTQRLYLGRYENLSAALTLQATRNQGLLLLPRELDGSPGGFDREDTGWLRFASGSLSYDNARWLGVPRLRLAILGSVNTQQVHSRAAGDIDAPRQRVSRSLEARVEYAIGRLEARLTARAAKVDERSVALLHARIQRRF
jgi:hypothetical protein